MPVLRTRHVLTADGARIAVEAGLEHARAAGLRVVVAVVDPWGRLLHLARTDDAQPASDRVAVDKARTAAVFVRPSRDIEQQVSDGRLGALALHGAAALVGGVPIVVDGEVVAAVGTSGETPDEDEGVSLAAASAVRTQDVPVAEEPALTSSGARVAGDAVLAEAARRGVAPVVAVVDSGGVLVHLGRPDSAQVASVDVATDKARTAALFRRPSKDFEDQAASGRPSALHLAGAVPLQGGLPVVVDGRVAGAVGVSGASSAEEDSELSALGVAALLEARSASVKATHLSAAELDRRFATGGLFAAGPGYALDAGRRTGPGEVELHDRVTDVMHVVRGTATVVTDGESHDLEDGDVLVVPAGVAHEFTAVSDPFLYLVTKVEGGR